MNQLPTVIFSFRIADLLEEVTKRTSYIGKMRGDEKNPHMIDIMSLTSGEDFLFNEFVEDAAHKTYDWLKAFGRNIPNALHARTNPKDVVIWRNHGLLATHGGEEIPLDIKFDVNSSYSLREESPVIIHVEESTPTRLKQFLSAYIKYGEDFINILVQYADELYMTSQPETFCYKIQIATTTSDGDIQYILPRYRDADKDGMFAWGSEKLTVYTLVRTPSEDSEVIYEGDEISNISIVSTEYIRYNMPAARLEDVEYYENYSGIVFELQYKDELGIIKVDAEKINLDTAISGCSALCDVKYRYTIFTTLRGYQVEPEVREYVVPNVELHKSTEAIDLSTQLEFEWLENTYLHRLRDVKVDAIVYNVRPYVVADIEPYSYVEYHGDFNNPESFVMYEVNNHCTNLDWLRVSEKLIFDPRNRVVFLLERNPFFDDNLIHSIDRDIKEAIVSYVIYRWFEYVNLQEAEKFYLKFEDYAHKAQLGMNSETKIQQRKYKLF